MKLPWLLYYCIDFIHTFDGIPRHDRKFWPRPLVGYRTVLCFVKVVAVQY